MEQVITAKQLINTIVTKTVEISKKRDDLRMVYDDLADLLDTLDSGIEHVITGSNLIEVGLDDLSKLI